MVKMTILLVQMTIFWLRMTQNIQEHSPGDVQVVSGRGLEDVPDHVAELLPQPQQHGTLPLGRVPQPGAEPALHSSDLRDSHE